VKHLQPAPTLFCSAVFGKQLSPHQQQQPFSAGAMTPLHLLILSLVPLMATICAIPGINLGLWSAEAAGLSQVYLHLLFLVIWPLSTWCCC
jgi:hypothetical protein